ncbi:MAG: hypothetical protein WCY23_05080 [Candidatus Omnitrophota bacterium]
MKKTLIVLLGLMLCEQQCYANPIIPNPFVAIPSLLLEAVIVAICVIPFRLNWFRFLYCWPLATFITWVVSGVMLMGYSFALQAEPDLVQGVNARVVIVELIITLIEALILNAMSKNKYFMLTDAKPLGFAKSLILSVIANAASYFTGIYIYMEYFKM